MIKKVWAGVVSVGVMLLTPLASFAAITAPYVPQGSDANLSRLGNLLNGIYTILNDIILPGILVLALIFFMWGVAMFILGSGDPEKREQGKHVMTWGIVALFVIVAVWGIVYWLASLFGVSVGGGGEVPGVIRR